MWRKASILVQRIKVGEKILVGRATEHTISYVFPFVYKSAVAEMFK